jgi:outer membrane putative beta-barrel porin/alpha-amylase
MNSQSVRLAWCLAVAVCPLTRLHAQDLLPRAYVITPVHANAVVLTWSYFNGGVDFNGLVPITDQSAIYSIPIFSYYHSFSFLGRSANITGSLPYGVGTFQASAQLSAGEVHRQSYKSGLVDSGFRLSVNLKGGPAMPAKEFAQWKQKVLLGASVRVIAPTGQYDPHRLINWGINRWAFKPEFGYSQRWGNLVLDGSAGVWFYTMNNASFSIPAPAPQTLEPIGSFEGHLSRDFGQRRFWASLDGNFWFGGIASLNGIQNSETRRTSSRIGGTASFPLNKHQSIKASYSISSYTRIGGSYQNVSVAWQYSWLGKP